MTLLVRVAWAEGGPSMRRAKRAHSDKRRARDLPVVYASALFDKSNFRVASRVKGENGTDEREM